MISKKLQLINRYVWYYEQKPGVDKKTKPINNFNVIRFEAQNITDNKILQELEQRFYTFKSNQMNK